MKKRQTYFNNWYHILIFVTVNLLSTQQLVAQPFIDIANIKYTNSPNTGLVNQNKNDVKILYYGIGTNIPLQFNNKKDAVIFSPFFETWSSNIINNKRQNYYSVALPVSLSKTIPYTKWSFLLTGIIRMNDSSINKKTNMQVGGAFIVSKKSNENLTWKLGLYVNNELFGLFVMPLAGIDWRINTRNNLFGILPGNLTYEHKINEHFYYGANFRAITNSYTKSNSYWRIDENQLGLYLDTYFNKNLVLNVEAGHSLFRKVRTGEKHISKIDANVKDNFYFKLSFAYRVRFAKK
jgi:Domain of unknown function (DUF6268)